MFVDDPTRLRHIRDSAREALDFIAGRSRADLDTDRILALALVQCLSIIGEAGARLTPEARAAMPAIPWTDIVGMRNRIVHAYFQIQLDYVWDTLVNDPPALLTAVEQEIANEPDDPQDAV